MRVESQRYVDGDFTVGTQGRADRRDVKLLLQQTSRKCTHELTVYLFWYHHTTFCETHQTGLLSYVNYGTL